MRRGVRDGFAKVLEELAAIGYKHVEFAGYTQGNDGEITRQAARKLLDDYGLKAIGSHVSPNSDASMTKILDDAEALGIPNVGISLPLPGRGRRRRVEGAADRVQPLRRAGGERGRRVLPAQPLPRVVAVPDDPTKRGEDVLLAETDPRYVFFEMDIYWAYVGQSQSGQVQRSTR